MRSQPIESEVIALINRGLALQSANQFSAAIEAYTQALAIKPGLAGALVNRSNSLRSLRRSKEALLDLDAALRLRPEFPEAHNNRGNVLRDLGRFDEAVASFDAALAQRADFIMALCNRGNALLDLKKPRAALSDFESALRLDPRDPEGLFGRAAALLALHEQLEAAVRDFDSAAANGLDIPEVLVGKATACAELGQHREAVECLRQVREIAPDREYVLGSLLHSLQQTCDWDALPELTEELQRRLPLGQKVIHPQSLLSLSDSPELQLRCAQETIAQQFPANDALGPCRYKAHDKIRIAYVSADFRDHPVSELLAGVLREHDRNRFEIIGVSLRPGPVRGKFDRCVDVSETSDLEVARLLREMQVDIAVDLMGHTQGMRAGIFSYRVAPVQVAWLGYAGTTGAPYMDYLLADAVTIPTGEERWYSEKVIHLPRCFLPNDSHRVIGPKPTRARAGLPERGFVFCAFTSTYKLSKDVFSVWQRLLAEVPDSVLWLSAPREEARENLGPLSERVVFAPRVANMAEHLGRLSLADLYLDTFPYNAHSTACDALWAGVPVLTRMGRGFASRVAASAVRAAGLPELVTQSLDEYERKAIALARRPGKLLVDKHCALFDTRAFTRDLESTYLGLL
jgi:protein O-GlcNAc transferase